MASPSLESLLATLATSDVEFIVVGMLAAVAQGAPVTTHDLDIVHRRTPENVARLIDLLVNKLDARYRGRPDVLRPTAEILAGTDIRYSRRTSVRWTFLVPSKVVVTTKRSCQRPNESKFPGTRFMCWGSQLLSSSSERRRA